MAVRDRGRRRPGAARGVTYVHDGARALPAGRRGRRLRLLDRDAAAAAELDQPALPARARQRRRPGRPLRDGAGRAAGRGPLPRAAAHVQGAAAGDLLRAVLRDRRSRAASRAASRSRRSARCRSAGPSTCSPTATGARRCASTCATTTTGPCSARSASCCRSPRTASRSPTRRTSSGMPVARFDYTQCDNDRANIAYAKQTLHDIWEAAGAQDVLTIDRYAHLVGGCRMGADAGRQRRRLGPPRLGRAEPVRLRRQRDADPGQRQPGADDHGARVAAGRAARPSGSHRRRPDPGSARELHA